MLGLSRVNASAPDRAAERVRAACRRNQIRFGDDDISGQYLRGRPPEDIATCPLLARESRMGNGRVRAEGGFSALGRVLPAN